MKTAPGSILLYVIVFGALSFSFIVIGVAGYAIGEHRAGAYRQNSELAFQIAEAGIEYYRWHLNHDPEDFQDGTGVAGPYVHEFKSGDEVIGYYSLNIIPPQATSSVTVVESTGWLASQPQSKRTIRVKLGSSSFTDLANYAFVGNTDIWVGNDTIINGRIHSNNGIRFDGVATAPVTSAVASYQCQPIHGEGCQNQTKPGIWGQGGPQSFWKFPVAAKDFSTIASDLANIKSLAQESGLYFSASGQQGWYLHFLTNGTFTAAKVTATDCYAGQDLDEEIDSWYCIDIKTTDTATTYIIPTSSYIFVEDTVFVDGVVKGRVTIGSGAEKSIIINDDLTYDAKDGTNAIGLIADQHVLLPHDSPEDLEVNAVIYAKNGAARRYYYAGDFKDSLLLYGSVISAGTWTWSWISNGGAVVSGYRSTTIIYDSNLTYNPPGGFSFGKVYTPLFWEEVR
ncbi:MAG: hypothetical protein Q7K39_03200 [Candidatus Magasanikbacteria bacterium]|nr:hypothetical protein [Candidatus Magasanikbacteria bacterium]